MTRRNTAEMPKVDDLTLFETAVRQELQAYWPRRDARRRKPRNVQERIAAWRAGGELPRLTAAERAELDVETIQDLGDAAFRAGWQ